MIIDRLLLFTGTASGASGGITSTTNTDAPTTGTQTASNIIDIGVTSGIPTSASGAGARDLGIGDDPMLKLLVEVTVAFAGGVNMAVDFSGAPDDGTGNQGSFTVMWTSPTYLEANLVVGAQLANIDLPRVIPGQVLPRFYRLRFITSGTHNAGAVIGSIQLDRIDQIQGTGGALSGYPAGVTVSN